MCGVVLGALSSLAIMLLRVGELIAFNFICVLASRVPSFILLVLWVGLQSVNVAFPGFGREVIRNFSITSGFNQICQDS